MKNKTLLGIGALLLAGGLTIAAGIGSQVGGKWFKNRYVKTWFNSWGQNKQDNSDNEHNGNYTENLVVNLVNDCELMPLSVMAYSADNDNYADYAQNSTKITASVAPITTEARDFTWSAEWANPSSDWATGKNVSDYLSFTSTTWSADARTNAYVKVNQPFGEQIIITCSYDKDPTISASCTADYLKRVESATVNADVVMNGEVTLHSIDVVYTTGTIKGTITPVCLYAQLSDDAYNLLQPWRSGNISYMDSWDDAANGDSTFKQTGICGYMDEGRKDLTDPDCDCRFDVDYFISDGSDNYFVDHCYKTQADKYIQAAFIKCAERTQNNLRAVVEYTYTYGDIWNSDEVAYSEYVSMDPDWFHSDLLSVNGLGVDKDSILFF